MGVDLEIFSFHSISKGLIGECGHRGGYMECHNVDPFIIEQLYKLASIRLCPNVPGQILVALMVDPPREGSPSYALYQREVNTIYEKLKRRALKLQQAFLTMTDMTCRESQGAMYLFPKLALPQKLVEHARLLSKEPDEIYAMELLNATGIVSGQNMGHLYSLITTTYFTDVVCGTRKWIRAGPRDLPYSDHLPSS